MKDDRARILAAGFDGYLEKPVDVRALPAQVEALLKPVILRRRRPAAERAAAARGARAARATRWPSASSGEEALGGSPRAASTSCCSTCVMPGIDGYEVCRRLRADPATAFLPVVMITASGEQEKRRAIEAGADDFVTKPFDQAELLARVRSLLRVKRYHDEIEAFNRGLRRFLPPQVAELVKADPSVLDVHRREIAVVFCALHGFAALAEQAEPEDVMGVLDAYHAALGELVARRRGDARAADRRRADGRLQRPAAVRGAGRARRCGSRSRCATACGSWPRAGAGSASTSSSPRAWRSGHATIGRIGFERRWEYAPVGTVPTLAERLCESAGAGQILIGQRVFAATEGVAITQPVGELALRGFSQARARLRLLGLETAESAAAAPQPPPPQPPPPPPSAAAPAVAAEAEEAAAAAGAAAATLLPPSSGCAGGRGAWRSRLRGRASRSRRRSVVDQW